MKTKLITGLKKEVLVIEAKSKDIACGFIFNKYGVKELLKWELLGKPDEIKEEDVVELVEKVGSCKFTWKNYKNEGFVVADPLESFFSAIEKEIYWVNPLGNEPILHEYAKGRFCIHEPKEWERTLSEQKTFDRNRTLIFVKN